MQAPIREGVAPRAQTAPAPPAPTFVSDGVALPNPQATVLLDAVRYGFVWCASDYIDSCTVADPSPRLERSRGATTLSRDRLAAANLGRGAPIADRPGLGHRDPQPDHAALPAPAALVARRGRRARVAEAPGLADDCRALGGGGRRTPDPCRVAGRRARVRAPALPAVHRDGARRRSRGSAARRGRQRPDAPWSKCCRSSPSRCSARRSGSRRSTGRASGWTSSSRPRSSTEASGTCCARSPAPRRRRYLYYVVAWAWGSVFGLGEVGLRSLSALAGTATIPVAYGAGAVLVSRRAGIVAAALVATNPFLVWYSQEARSYALLALLGAATVLAFGLALRGARGVARRRGRCSRALAIATHYFAVFVVARGGGLAARAGPAAAAGAARVARSRRRLPRPRAARARATGQRRGGRGLLARGRGSPGSRRTSSSATASRPRLSAAPWRRLLVVVGLVLLVARSTRAPWRPRRGLARRRGHPDARSCSRWSGVDYLIARNTIAAVVPAAVCVGAGYATGRVGVAAAWCCARSARPSRSRRRSTRRTAAPTGVARPRRSRRRRARARSSSRRT